MIRHIKNNAIPIGVGFATALLIVCFLAALSLSNRNRSVSAMTLSAQTAVVSGTDTAEAALGMLAAQASDGTVAGFGTSPTTNLDPIAFRATSEDLFRRLPAALATAYFQRVDLKNVAEAMSARNAEGLTRFSRPGLALFLPVRILETSPGGDSVLGRKRLPFELAAGSSVQQALRQAIEANDTVASIPVVRDANGKFMDTSSVTFGGSPAATWFLKPVFAAGAGGRNRVDDLAGVAAVLIDASALAAPIDGGKVTLRGPSSVQPDATRLHDAGLFSSASPRAEVVFGTGAQSWALSVSPGSRGLFGAGLVGALFALLAGAGAGYGVSRVSGEDKGAADLYRQKFEAQQREFRRKTRQLKSSEERFRRLAESTKVIPWAADLGANQFTYIGPQIEGVSGYPPQSWYAPGYFFDHIHPGDRQTMIVDVLREIKPGEYITREYRTRSAGGTVLYLNNMFTVLPPRADKPDERLAQGFLLDVTEIKLAQEALKRARAVAEEADHTKSEFLANMSHELRTPLNAVVGFAEIMKDELLGPLDPRYRDYAISIHESGCHLLGLINDVLDLSKIEAGRIELIEEETDIGAMLASCRTLLHEKASSAGLHIRLEIPGVLPCVVADGRRLKQIVLNLMSNSIKFTRPGGRLTLRAEVREPKGIRLAIADTGVGMSKEEVDVAMSQFGQIDNDLSRHHDGTGLGLPIARSLAELHGGSLEITSARGAGTTVEIWLPLARIVHASARQAS